MTDTDEAINLSDLEPVTFEYKAFYIRLKDPLKPPFGKTMVAHARLTVDEHGYCELYDWYWFGKRDPHRSYSGSVEDRELLDVEREVWAWLEEWGLVELKPIGPEDSEFFATDLLLSGNFKL